MAKLGLSALLLLQGAVMSGQQEGMVLMPSGEFQRGRTYEWSDYDVKWYPNPAKDDRPVRRIALDAFYIDEAEITNERYAAFVKAKGHPPPFYWIGGQIPEGKQKHPVVNLTWQEAAAYCTWAGKRLPTEAEWERACRGNMEGKMFPWGDEDPTPKLARYGVLSGPGPVCTTAKSPAGLCDIIGNVWEWTADWYERKYYEVAPEKNPAGPEKGLYKVLRGGAWFDQPKLFMTCSYRSWARAEEKSPTIGFRCAKTAQ